MTHLAILTENYYLGQSHCLVEFWPQLFSSYNTLVVIHGGIWICGQMPRDCYLAQTAYSKRDTAIVRGPT